MIGDVLAHRTSRKRLLPIDPNNPYGIVDGVARLWITRERVCLAIVDMADSHLMRTINMIERRAQELRDEADDALSFHAGCRGDMASYYSGHAFEDAFDVSLAYDIRAIPILAGLRAEAKRRGLAEVVPGTWVRKV